MWASRLKPVVLKYYLIFQCNHDVQSVQKTLHILSDHKKRPMAKIQEYLHQFLRDIHHLKWVREVSQHFIQRKKIPFGDYLQNLEDISIPLDQVGLLVYARMYHQHFAIILRNSIWTTRADNKYINCAITLAYCGGVSFVDTCSGPGLRIPSPPPALQQEPTRNKPINLSGRKRTRSSTPAVKPKVKKPRLSIARRASLRIANRLLASKKPKPKGRQTRNSKKTSALLSLDVNTLDNKRKKREVAPKNLKEKDILADHLDNLSPLPSNAEESDEDTEIEDVPKQVIKTKNGQVEVKTIGLKKSVKRKNSDIKCNVCEDRFPSQRQVNIHLKKQHPDFKFVCDFCPETHATYNSNYRHMQSHFELPHSCTLCPKRFLYPFQRDSHIRTHTGKGLTPCEWRGCRKKFTSKRSMHQHLEKHRNKQDGKKWKCKQCKDKPTFDTRANFAQHTRGLHGPGFKARCGKIYKWPAQRKAHQKDCTECKRILEKRQNMPANPVPKKLRKVLPAFKPSKENTGDSAKK